MTSLIHLQEVEGDNMRFFQKTKGAISIFLVIILVPMMTVSSLFVDASKVKLARAMAESAGDLTLNTALTNYDTKLKELYGLLATAQDTSDLFAKLEDYYRTCITSSGVSAEDADTYVEQIMAQLGIVAENSDTADIMNMELVDFSVEKYTDADLANATILEKQIVDFMKYRAPINTGLSFISSLKSFSTLSKQSELVEKKQEYYEAQQTVLEDLKTAWSHIAAYNNSPVVTDSNYLTGIKPTLDGYADDYQNYGKRTIMSLYQKYDKVVTYQYYLNVGQVKENKYDVKDGELDEEVTVWTINYNNTPYYSYLSSYYNNPYNYDDEKFPTVAEVKSAVTEFYNAKKNSENKSAPVYDSSYYSIQFIAQKKAEIETYTSTEINLFTAYQKLKNVLLWLDGYEKVEIKDDDGNVITKSSILAEELKIGSTTKTISQWITELNADSIYELHMYDLSQNATVFTNCSVNAQNEYYAQFAITDTMDISTAISNIQVKAKGYVDTLDSAIKNLEEAIKYLESAKTKLGGTVASAKTNWNNVANDTAISGTSLAKQDQAEIDQLDTYLNETNIQKLITRLENIKTDLTSVRDEVKGYKFADKFIGEIDGYSGDNGLEKVVGSKWNDLNSLSMKKSEISNTATSRAASAWSTGNIKTDWITQSSHQPDLLQDKVSMYTYLSSHFAGTAPATDSASTETKEADTENGENLYNSIKDTSESTANSTQSGSDGGQAATETSKGNNITSDTFSNLPSKISSVQGGSDTPSGTVNTKIDGDDSTGEKGAAGKSANALNSLFSAEFLSAIADMGEDLRDKLYVSDYIMSMFSYDTIENEYKVQQKAEGNTVDEIQAGMLLSLTKNDISATNNYAYGSEIEYILYGGTNSSNLTKAYGTIYGIRFGFNLVYAFATSEIRDSALAIATPISAATLGIIPVPLVQAVIIIGIACCESAIDLCDLRDGEQVPLYKSSETWHCSITGLTNVAKGKVGEILKDVSSTAVSAGVNELNKYLDMTDEQLTQAIQSGTNNVEQAITNAYDQVITENANAAIQQLTTLVNTAVESASFLDVGETYEGKKAEMKQWVKTQLQSWASQQSGNDLASKVKREAANIIVSNSDICIDQLFDTVENTVRNSEAGSTIDDILNGASTVENGVDKLGGEIMEYVEVIRTKITESINSAGNEIQQYKDQMMTSVRESINNGAEDLKNTINSQIDGIFGTTTGSDNSTGMASLCSFSYSEYLRLFLLIGLYTNEGKIILRTADVIQANMVHTGSTGFELKNSAAYVKLTATIQVKPTLLALPIFADVESNPVDNSKWYTITYSGIAGY